MGGFIFGGMTVWSTPNLFLLVLTTKTKKKVHFILSKMSMKITLKNAYGPFCPQELESNKLLLSKRELIGPHTKRELESRLASKSSFFRSLYHGYHFALLINQVWLLYCSGDQGMEVFFFIFLLPFLF